MFLDATSNKHKIATTTTSPNKRQHNYDNNKQSNNSTTTTKKISSFLNLKSSSLAEQANKWRVQLAANCTKQSAQLDCSLKKLVLASSNIGKQNDLAKECQRRFKTTTTTTTTTSLQRSHSLSCKQQIACKKSHFERNTTTTRSLRVQSNEQQQQQQHNKWSGSLMVRPSNNAMQHKKKWHMVLPVRKSALPAARTRLAWLVVHLMWCTATLLLMLDACNIMSSMNVCNAAPIVTNNNNNDELLSNLVDVVALAVGEHAPQSQGVAATTTTTMNEQQQLAVKRDGAELFGIERRRLNRDRALEPPAWLRDRPIRRDASLTPTSDDDDDDGDAVGGQRFVRGRQSRQSRDELYEEVMRHLIEEALDGHALLDSLYDELHTSNAHASQQQQLQQNLQQQQQLPHHHVDTTNGAHTLPTQDASQTLDVAGDDVNDSDDVTLLEGVARNLQEAQQLNKMTQPLVGGSLADARELNSSSSVGATSLLDLLQATNPSGGSELEPNERQSFHVLEEIDQVDNSDEMPAVGDTQQQVPEQQQQQQREWPYAMSQFGDNDDDGEQDDQSPSPIKRRVSLLSRDEKRAAAAAGAVAGQLSPLAIRLIRSGYFTRRQLLQLAGRVRAHLERALRLRPATILGLFPVDARQLLVAFDATRLSARERAQLEAQFNYNYSPASSSLVLKWPAAAAAGTRDGSTNGDSPIPLLAAILEAVHANANDDDAQTNELDVSGGSGTNSVLVNNRDTDDDDDNEHERDDEDDDNDNDNDNVDMSASEEYGKQRNEDIQEDGMWPNHRRPPATSSVERRGDVVQQIMRPNLFEWRGVPSRRVLMAPPYFGRQRALMSSGGDDGELQFIAQQEQQQAPVDWLLDDKPVVSSSSSYSSPALAAYLSLLIQQQQQQRQRQVPILQPNEQLDKLLNKLTQNNQQLARLNASSSMASSLYGVLTHLISSAATVSSPPSVDTNTSTNFLLPHLLLVAGSVLALLGTFFVVKLIVYKLDKRLLATRRQRNEKQQTSGSNGDDKSEEDAQQATPFWTTFGGTLASERANKSAPCASEKRKLSADSGLDTIVCSEDAHKRTNSRQNLDLLAQRLMNFLSTGAKQHAPDNNDDTEQQQQQRQRKQLKQDDESVTLLETCANRERQTFRSSTSYIRSLIEALSKAAGAQLAGGNGANITPNDDDDDDEEDDDADDVAQLGRCNENNNQLLFDDEGDDEILVSQMDISAAHLILDYMEKHLIDKERLRREWLELNASLGGEGSALISDSPTTKKAHQLLVQRLARVALSGENYGKNRDPNVVPFDRNRVRLGKSLSKRPTTTTTTTTTGADDYVNASFIYDADPRKPTHIIAQGPCAQTCGQFWQMIWEQDISVIVMLTRLNENGRQMCHCYWPTSSSGNTSLQQQQQQQEVKSSSPSSSQSSSPSSSRQLSNEQPQAETSNSRTQQQFRRCSVTSVLSGPPAALSGKHTTTHASNNGGPLNNRCAAPIVACGPEVDGADNVLVFELPACTRSSTTRSNSKSKGAAATTRAAAAAMLTLEVHLVSEHVSSSDYLVRNLCVVNKLTGETRTVSQFHYLAWPHKRTPDSVRTFLQFRRKVHKSYRNSNSPILVHCNDGAGRSGTYILIDLILERIRAGAKEIDLRATLEHLRDQRVGVCETQSQFEFVLVALAEEIQIILNALPQ